MPVEIFAGRNLQNDAMNFYTNQVDGLLQGSPTQGVKKT
jgi:hypothetical protein